jgi:hypothetical protein
MVKTGERYAAARRHVVKTDEDVRGPDLPQPDGKVREHTGHGWKAWLRILDAWGAKQRTHKDVAGYLMEEHGVPGWWAQTITVGYERARGIRARHQTLDGSFQVSVSKTFPIGVGPLFRAFAEARERKRWLEPGTLKVRKTNADRSVRFDFRDGTSRVVVSFDPKDLHKTTVTIQHERLPDPRAVEEMRGMWKEHLTRLAEVMRA